MTSYPGRSRWAGPIWLTLTLIALVVALAACQGQGRTPTGTSPAGTPTDIPPSPTPLPAAVRVNGEIVPLAYFEAEVARYEAAKQSLGIELATLGDYKSDLLEALIDEALLVDGARSNGVEIPAQQIQRRVDGLVAEIGGNEAMGEWLAANGYSILEFEWSLERSMLAAEMIALITNPISDSAEHVHAYHILVDDPELAAQLRAELSEGADFGELAAEHSLDLSTRLGGGDLGWISRGTLTVPEVEQAALELGEGELSEVVESPLGYHLIRVTARSLRPLTPEARDNIHRQAVENWIRARRETAEIERLIEP